MKTYSLHHTSLVLRRSVLLHAMRCTITKRFWWGLKFIIVPTTIMINPLMHWRSIDFKSTVLFIRAQKDRSSGNNRVAHDKLGLSTQLRSWKELQTIHNRGYYLAAFTVYVVILISSTSAGFALVWGESSYVLTQPLTSTSARTDVCYDAITWRSNTSDYTGEGHMWLGFNYFSYVLIGCFCMYVCDWMPLLKSL